MAVTHLHIVRTRTYGFLVELRNGVNADTIVRSWGATGVPRALWGDAPGTTPLPVLDTPWDTLLLRGGGGGGPFFCVINKIWAAVGRPVRILPLSG